MLFYLPNAALHSANENQTMNPAAAEVSYAGFTPFLEPIPAAASITYAGQVPAIGSIFQVDSASILYAGQAVTVDSGDVMADESSNTYTDESGNSYGIV